MAKQNLTPRINRLESNIIIDGGHEIWPEGTSRSVANNANAYGSVLFNLINTASNISLTNSQSSSVPSGTSLVYSNQVSKTAAGTLASTTNIRLRYGVEGFDVDKIYNRDFSVIFWVKSSVATNRSLSIRNGSSPTHSYVKQYTINAANTWELKVVTFPALNTCPGTISRDSNMGLNLSWAIVNGSNFQTSTLGSWVATNSIQATGEETTWLTGTNHDFSIAGTMILPGDWSALTSSGYAFLRAGRNFSDELVKSNRYYLSTFPFGTAAAQASGNTAGALATSRSSGTSFYATAFWSFPVELRASPQLTTYNPTQANANFRTNADNADLAVSTLLSTTKFAILNTNNVVNAGVYGIIHASVDARYT